MRRRSPRQFVAFDILWLDGRDLRMLPLVERKRILRSQVPESGTVLYSTPIQNRGVELFAEVCANDLEGCRQAPGRVLQAGRHDLGQDQ
jgi:ATP-dependent DNA ligase